MEPTRPADSPVSWSWLNPLAWSVQETTQPPLHRPMWLLEGGFWCVVLAAALLYGLRMTALPVRGEESRRATVAVEMLRTGDFVVPRQQGEVYYSRPPLQNWAIAAVGVVRGQVDVVAIRLPSMLAMLLTVGMVYVYVRLFSSQLIAFCSALAMATFGQSMEIGGLGETEAMFTCCVAGSLLVWHYGLYRRWPSWLPWTAGYLLMAGGLLTKGLQAPLYFVLTTTAYCWLTGRFRFWLSWQHLLGIIVAVAVCLPWHLAYYQAVGLEGLTQIYGYNVAIRFQHSFLDSLEHWVTFPIELVLACLLPWSLLAWSLWDREVRDRLARHPLVVFCLCGVLIALPSIWIPAGGKTRYLLPLYPCVAAMFGMLLHVGWVERLAAVRAAWSRLLIGLALLAVAIGPGLLVANAWLPSASPYRQAWPFVIGMSGAAIAALAALLWARTAQTNWQRAIGMTGGAAVVGLLSVGLIQNLSLSLSEHRAAEQALAVREELPPRTALYSLGRIDHLFAYHFGDRVRPIHLDANPDAAEELDWFCFNGRVPRQPLPFAWRAVRTVTCERFQQAEPERVVTIARRIRQVAAKPGGKTRSR